LDITEKTRAGIVQASAPAAEGTVRGSRINWRAAQAEADGPQHAAIDPRLVRASSADGRKQLLEILAICGPKSL
jgi:hypothetical protein